MEKSFPRDIGVLDDLFSFLDAFINEHQLDASVAFAVNLVAEELFVNMVKYHSDNPSPVSVSLKKEEDRLVMELVDFNVDVVKGAMDVPKKAVDRLKGTAETLRGKIKLPFGKK